MPCQNLSSTETTHSWIHLILATQKRAIVLFRQAALRIQLAIKVHLRSELKTTNQENLNSSKNLSLKIRLRMMRGQVKSSISGKIKAHLTFQADRNKSYF
jgi:hypothetical protein